MGRIILEHSGDQIILSPGAHTMGRGLTCALRLNDPGVSREHARLEVSESGLTVTDLGSRNGTFVNGRPVNGPRPVRSGDVLLVGGQRIRVLIEGAGPDFGYEEITQDRRAARASSVPPVSTDGGEALSLPAVHFLTCPGCRNRIPVELRTCPTCGHVSRPAGPLYETEIIDTKKMRQKQLEERRQEPRTPVDLLVLYVSDNLSLNAVARDLSMGGVFVAADVLDEVGTSCDITFLPEARPAVQVRGIVRHLAKTAVGTRAKGMGIKFTHWGLGGKDWLRTVMKRTR